MNDAATPCAACDGEGYVLVAGSLDACGRCSFFAELAWRLRLAGRTRSIAMGRSVDPRFATPEFEKRLHLLLAQKTSLKTVRRELCIGARSLKREMDRLGLKCAHDTARGGAFANAERLEELRRLRRENLLASEIADAMGLCAKVVRLALPRLAADCGDAAVIKAREREKARAASADGGAKAAETRRRIAAEAAGRGQAFRSSAHRGGVQLGGGGLQGVITDAQRAALRRAVLAWQSDRQAATEAGLPLAEAKRVIALHRSAWLAETRWRGAQPKPAAPLPPRTHERLCIACREWGSCSIGSLRCCACVAAEVSSHAS